ncbi:MerR family transcriptional regulator [Mobilicoccus massiliensis]|uniref:MerR family transcriptional regulator n=1 Tax=Mobilicoccus massiliensis TaxID=1522310 RepID=UPI001FE9D233|nr:MerR family transcriptional regulator [Mobilicoccus massiliensis]
MSSEHRRRAPSTAGPSSGYVTPHERALTGDELRSVDLSPRFRIGEVSERLGLSLRSIRYYEEAGLITPSARTSGGFRMYSEADVQRMLGIMQMKPLGFTLERMGEVLADLDVLRDTEAPGSERRSARSRLEELHDEMAVALADLRQQLEIAAQFTTRLDDELTEFDRARP